MRQLTDRDHERVSAAIAAAEAGTSGEILAVCADQSDAYHDVALHYAVAALLLVLAVSAWQPALLHGLWSWIAGGWNSTPSEGQLLSLLTAFALAQFLVVLFVLKIAPLRLALTPGPTKTRRVRRRAIILFKTAAERRTAGRTGVLLYLSMAERRAELVGDDSITRAIAPQEWADAMAALLVEVKAGRPAQGIVAAIGKVGEILARDFPHEPGDRNEIPDKLIEL